MARKRLLSIFILAAGAWAQPAIAPPQLGFIEDGARALRPAYGLAGNFILGPAVARKVVTAAFSGSIGLLKTESSLAAFDSHGKVLASMDAAAGPALFAFSPAGTTALAYIASSKALVEWLGSAFAPIPLNNQEVDTQEVLAVAFPTPFEASLFVQQNDTIWEVRIPLGKWGDASRNALAGVHGPLLALPAGDLLYRGTAGIVIRRTDGSEVPIAGSLPTRFSLQQMNQDWVQLTGLAGGPRFAIRTTPGREALYQLPERTK
jgi:hypothetical protein